MQITVWFCAQFMHITNYRRWHPLWNVGGYKINILIVECYVAGTHISWLKRKNMNNNYYPSTCNRMTHNERREGEYVASIVWPNALYKFMMQQPVFTLGVECFDLQHENKCVLFYTNLCLSM